MEVKEIIYTREDVLKSALKYFKGDELSANVWINKYCLKDSDGNFFEKTPDDMHHRIASELARIEKNYENPMSEGEIFDLLKDFKYIVPQGGSMSGIGNKKQVVSLSNCFVIGNTGESDSYGGVMRIDEEQVQLMKRRGGVGHDLSHIRPKGTPVKNSALTSTGVVPFMERYSNSTREVGQDGRRGALMLSMDIHHPNAEDFMNAKLEEGKVTGANISLRVSDKFMEAAINGGEFTQQYPVGVEHPHMTKQTKATPLLDKLVYNAWKSAEPGVLFWDTIINESVADCYADVGYKTVSTNPCLVGDTMVAVADGRGQVTIKELADEGKDIPVFSLDNNNKLTIKTMRNPRLTGKKESIFKVTTEGGHEIRTTGNHKLMLKNGKYVEVKNLKSGDSLLIMTKSTAAFHDVMKGSNSKSQDYSWLTVNGEKGLIPEHRLIAEHSNNTKLSSGDVVHHKDFKGLNNTPNNLQIMTKKEHDLLHSKNMVGTKNPYHKMTEEWKKDFSNSDGENNGKYLNITNIELRTIGKLLTKKNGTRLSNLDWAAYAKEFNLPQTFSKFREKELGTITDFLKECGKGLDNYGSDPRLVKTYRKGLENGYKCEIKGNQVLVTKKCETCGKDFKIDYHKREIAFCSHECSLAYVNSCHLIKETRTNAIKKTYSTKAEATKNNQIKICSDLKFKLGREPKLNEWETACRDQGTPYRLKTKFGFQNFKEVKIESELYNHKIISIELDGHENVFNGTVDDNHNFFIGGFQELNQFGKPKLLYINNQQCGEITLSPYDSCRLLVLNLYSYVVNPFTKDAYFDFVLFKKHVEKAQRIMDDILDLEIEKIDQILTKIASDPEPDDIKYVEKNLWEKIKKSAIDGRRTGLGITAEGDMIAAMGLTYGTKKATKFATNVHKTLAIETYRASAMLAKERGSFPVWDREKEKGNPFLERLIEADPSLKELLDYGRRNIALLTVSPSGTVSLMTQTTSGIESAFMIAYKRNRKVNPNDKDVKVSFVDQNGDSWESYSVLHHHFKTWVVINGYSLDDIQNYTQEELDELVKKSPFYKATANDVDWLEKVRMQGSIQKWIDHSISVTVNLPKETTKDVVADVYKEAWKSGCKGITVYRDGSRTGVLVSDTEKINEILKENNAPKRPKNLQADVLMFQNHSEKWIGFIGKLDDKPYEMFTGLLESFPIPSYVEQGIIRKNKIDDKSSYDFIYIDKDGYEQTMRGLSRAFNKEYWNYGKLISAVIRHGMPIPSLVNVVSSLDLPDLIVSWKSGVVRMFKKYIKDNEVSADQKCPECGNKLTFTDGCLSCKDTPEKEGCGWSKCG